MTTSRRWWVLAGVAGGLALVGTACGFGGLLHPLGGPLTANLDPCRQDFRRCGPTQYPAGSKPYFLTEREYAFLTAPPLKSGPGVTYTIDPNSDYHHGNTIYTHGVGLQPPDISFPYAATEPFPFAGGKAQLVATTTKGPEIFDLYDCVPFFSHPALPDGPLRCTLADLKYRPICDLTTKEKTVTVLRGEWSPSAGFLPKNEQLTIACGVDVPARTDGAISKCLAMVGVCPENALERFNACVRAVTAQYCGGTCAYPGAPQFCSYTNVGTVINLYTQRLTNGKTGTYLDPVTGSGGSLCPTCLDPPPGCYEGAWSGARAVGLTKPRLAKVKVDCEPQYVDVDVAGGTSYVKGLRDAGILWSRFDSDGGPGCWDPDCALDVGVKPICKANHACY